MNKLWELIKSPGLMAVLAVVGFGLAIYIGFFFERRSQLAVLVDPPSRVFDIHQPIGGIEVSYAGENLRCTKKTLWIISAALKNIGNAEIRKGDYDEQVPLGLHVEGGHIVDIPSFRTSVPYLEQNLKLRSEGQNLLLSSVIFEPNDSVHLNLLVLGSESTPPTLSALGKLAGSRGIALINGESGSDKTSLWRNTTDAASWWIHLLRVLLYGLGGFIAFGITAALLAGLGSAIQSLLTHSNVAKRRAKIDAYEANEAMSKERRFVSAQYVQEGNKVLYQLRDIISCLDQRAKLCKQLDKIVPDEEIVIIARDRYPLPFRSRALFEAGSATGIFPHENGALLLSDALLAELDHLFAYLGIDPNAKPDRDMHELNYVSNLHDVQKTLDKIAVTK